MVAPRRGDIWWAEAHDKRRPVLIVTRSEAIAVLDRILAAPITSTVRRIPTEISLDDEHRLERRCGATFDNLQPIRKTCLTSRVGGLDLGRVEICRALAAARSTAEPRLRHRGVRVAAR